MCFCGSEESVEHLFIECKFAKLIWQVVYFTFNMSPPTNVKSLFGNWLNCIDRKTKSRIHVGVYAILGQYGIAEMMSFFIMQLVLNFFTPSDSYYSSLI
jgi:hypothetical protein